MSRWRLIALSILGLSLMAAAPSITTRLASGVLTSTGTVLTVGAVSDGQVLGRSGSTVAGLTAAQGRTALSAPQVHVTTSAPTTGDDSADGYAVGDIWSDTSANLTYIADSVSVGAADWRLLLKPNAAYIQVTGGAIVAQGGLVDHDGGFIPASATVALTAEDDTYGEVISTDTITVASAGLTTGDTGAIQSNSRRYKVALSSLGIMLTGSASKQASIRLLCDSITDLDARAGTLALVTWLGVSSTTALDITGIQRPATGTATYQEVHAATSATSLTTGTASSANFGSMLNHSYPSDSGTLFFGGLDVNGLPRATGAASGGAISASNPDTIVWALRASAGASGATFTDCRALYVFGGAMADL